jgi:quinol monooxygenase YgiN
MIVIHVSFRVGNPNRAAFDAWFLPLARRVREQEGCIAYDYRVDPTQPDRGFVVEVWESAEALAQCEEIEAHKEIIDGLEYWQMEDTWIHWWHEAAGYRVIHSPDRDLDVFKAVVPDADGSDRAMAVVYASFRVGHRDRAAFDAWLLPLIGRVRAQEGCTIYDYWLDPVQPERGVIFQAWESEEAFNRYSKGSEHTELVGGCSRWSIDDTWTHWWQDADGFELKHIPSPEGIYSSSSQLTTGHERQFPHS